MPKILEYLGIIIRFYSDEHEPIHVHAQYGDSEMKVEFYIEDHVIVSLKYLEVKGKEPLSPKVFKQLQELIEEYKYIIVEEWINYFVFHAKPKVRKITKKL